MSCHRLLARCRLGLRKRTEVKQLKEEEKDRDQEERRKKNGLDAFIGAILGSFS